MTIESHPECFEVDMIRNRIVDWRRIWGDDPGVHGACADLEALFVHYDALTATVEEKDQEIERLNLALVAASEPDLLKRGSRR